MDDLVDVRSLKARPLVLHELMFMHEPPKQNWMFRVFLVRGSSGTASAFIYDRGQIRYFVTCAHVLNTDDTVEVFLGGEWLPGNDILELLGKDEEDDIAILRLKLDSKMGKVRQANTPPLIHGQNLFFLGYPLGFFGNWDDLQDYEKPIPFVKSAIVSQLRDSYGAGYLDGWNNPGFSGGPVLTCSQSFEHQVVGMIQGYMKTSANVEELQQGEKPSKSGLYVSENTGLIQFVHLSKIDRFIDKIGGGGVPALMDYGDKKEGLVNATDPIP